MTMAALLTVASIALTANWLAALSARTLAEFSPAELEELCRRRNRPDRLGNILQRRQEVSVALQSLRTLALALAAGAGGVALWRHAEALDFAAAAWVPALAAGLLVLLAANLWLPWTFAKLWADPLLFRAWPLLWTLSFLLLPFGLLARVVDVALHRLAGRRLETRDEESESFEEDIRTIVTEGHREGLLEEDAREMIEGVIKLGDVDVSRVMTPRTDMISLPASLSWEEMLAAVIDAGHTRIPVYGRNRDDILGILHTKDLLPELAHGQHAEHWTKLLRQPVFVPETKPVDALLQELQRGRNHMVVVLDEYGGVSGLVTIEDVLEEIVGEIADEYDPAEVVGVRDVAPGVCEALGRVHIDEINERLGLGLPEDADYDTIGGFVFNELGHVPMAGEDLVWHNVRITVLDATRRRIERVRIEVLDTAGLPGAGAERKDDLYREGSEGDGRF